MKWCAPLDAGIVVVGLHDDHIICAWLMPKADKSVLIRALARYPMPCSGPEYAPVFLQQKIDCFLKAYKLLHPTLVFYLADSWVPLSCCVSIDVATPTKALFAEYVSPSLWWNSTYVYPGNDNHTFYLYGAPYSTLFACQLCAAKLHAPLIAIFPQKLALLYLYRMLYPGLSATAKFFKETAVLSQDLFNKNEMKRFVSFDKQVDEELVSSDVIASLCGVWIAQQ